MSVIDALQKKAKIKYSDEQLAIVQQKGGIAIRACAGAAKTTVLTHLIARRILDGEVDATKLLCTTFSKAGAIEIETRLNKLLDLMGYGGPKVKVKTLHSVYLEILRHIGLNWEVTPSRTKYIRAALREHKIYPKTEDGNIEILSFDNIFSYIINSMLDVHTELETSLVFIQEAQALGINLKKFLEIKETVEREKKKDRVMDFDDMQLFVYILLYHRNNQNHFDAMNYIHTNYQYIFLDEFQDISKIQFEILRKMVVDPDKLMVVGDDDQCIYEWRGAAPEILNNITAYYPLKQMNLSTNYRCKSNILENAKRGIEYSETRVIKEMNASQEGGEVLDVCLEDITTSNLQYYNSSMGIASIVEAELKDKKTLSKDIAILIRDNSHGDILACELFDRGIHINKKKEYGINSSYILQDIVKVLKLAYDLKAVDSLERVVYKLAPGISYEVEKTIFMIVRNIHCDLKEALYHFLNTVKYGSYSVRDKDNQYREITDGLRRMIYQRGSKVSLNGAKSLQNLYYHLINEEEPLLLAKSLVYRLTQYNVMNTKSTKTQDYLYSIYRYVDKQLSEKGLSGSISFFDLCKAYSNSADVIGVPIVYLGTMNSAKGMEWKVVVIGFNDVLHLPNSNILARMEDVCSQEDIKNYYEGERRLYYVACTRAAERLYLLRPTESNLITPFRIEQMVGGKE